MTPETWWDFVQRISGHATPAQIGRDVRLDRSAPTRWQDGGGVEASMAVKVARAYQANVLEALVAAGFITAAEAQLRDVEVGITSIASLDLAKELVRRLDDRGVGGGRNDGVAPVTQLTPKQREAAAMTPDELETLRQAATRDAELDSDESDPV